MPAAIRMALQIPNFTYPDTTPAQLFGRVAVSAREAEAAGFDAVFVMDHFYQLPMLGPLEAEMLEAYPLLGALAVATTRVRLGTLVSGNTYRNPAHLAKIVTTLDVVSGGRAILGIGAGWFDPEHRGYGFDFPPIGERLSRLDEALQIIRAMLRGERPTFEGRFYRTHEALNLPAPVQPGGPAILIGGTGEQRTLRLVARYADESNWTCPPEEFPRKLEALEKHCASVGRSRREINVTWLGSLLIGRTMEEAQGLRDGYLRARGMDWGALPPAVRDRIAAALVVGDPDTVGEFVATRVIGQGLDGIVVNMPANGHDPEAVQLAARTLRAALR
jgi:F420-dependent oxidoreductase-like protein